MSLTVSNQSGDGVTADFIEVYVQLPDAGTSVLITGRIQAVGAASVSVSGSPLTIPAAPAAGSVFYNVQVDSVAGLATVQQSTVADPAPINAASRVVFRQVLVPASVDPAVTPEATPDTW